MRLIIGLPVLILLHSVSSLSVELSEVMSILSPRKRSLARNGLRARSASSFVEYKDTNYYGSDLLVSQLQDLSYDLGRHILMLTEHGATLRKSTHHLVDHLMRYLRIA